MRCTEPKPEAVSVTNSLGRSRTVLPPVRPARTRWRVSRRAGVSRARTRWLGGYDTATGVSHLDHFGSAAELSLLTGAPIAGHIADLSIYRAGGVSDPYLPTGLFGRLFVRSARVALILRCCECNRGDR